jgi:hypothetical protein
MIEKKNFCKVMVVKNRRYESNHPDIPTRIEDTNQITLSSLPESFDGKCDLELITI